LEGGGKKKLPKRNQNESHYRRHQKSQYDGLKNLPKSDITCYYEEDDRGRQHQTRPPELREGIRMRDSQKNGFGGEKKVEGDCNRPYHHIHIFCKISG